MLIGSLNQMLTEMMRGENHWCFFYCWVPLDIKKQYKARPGVCILLELLTKSLQCFISIQLVIRCYKGKIWELHSHGSDSFENFRRGRSTVFCRPHEVEIRFEGDTRNQLSKLFYSQVYLEVLLIVVTTLFCKPKQKTGRGFSTVPST